MKHLYLTVISLLFLLASIAHGQTVGSLAGTVTDEQGKAIRGATVRILGTSPARGAVTKENGTFLVAGVRANLYDIQITAVGYSTYLAHNIRISVDQTTTLNARLMNSGVKVDTVVVTTDAFVPERVGKQMQRSARTNIHGASALTPGANGFEIRGGPATETSIRVDGVEVSDPFAGSYGTSSSTYYPTVSTVLEKEAEVPSFQFSAEYGDVLSGVVNTTSANSIAPAPQRFNREGHSKIIENAFISTRDERFSTFGIDVDAASYTLMRRYLDMKQLPPANAVRIEEMVNYFSYDYPDPAGDAPFSITTEVAPCPWNPERRLVHIGIQGKRMPTADLPPSNLVFLIDVSGSMNSEDRLPLLKESLTLLVKQLRAQDRVAIVVYAGSAGLVLESTPGDQKEKIISALNRLSAGGSTAGGAGIALAYETAAGNFLKDGNNRVILATDGDFNVGVSSREELEKLITTKREEKIFLTVLGVGTDNYQDAIMETLADKGNGNYAYIDNLKEGERVLVREMGGTLFTIAKDVKIQVEFNPQAVRSYRLIGYENRLLERKDFHDDTKDAGELGAGHSVTTLYEVELVSMEADPQQRESPRTPPASGDRPSLGDLSGGRALLRPASYGQDTLMYLKLRYKQPADSASKLLLGPVLNNDGDIAAASENLRFSSAVAQLGMLLRSSQHKGNASYERTIELAKGALGSDPDGERKEFIDLVERSRTLAGSAAR